MRDDQILCESAATAGADLSRAFAREITERMQGPVRKLHVETTDEWR